MEGILMGFHRRITATVPDTAGQHACANSTLLQRSIGVTSIGSQPAGDGHIQRAWLTEDEAATGALRDWRTRDLDVPYRGD